MSFRIRGLDFEPFRPLVGLTDEQLRANGARRVLADHSPGYPDRVELGDAKPGERLLLLNYVHQTADSPYRASHAVYVLENADQTYDKIDEVPEVLRSRMISLRSFDDEGMIVAAELCPGIDLEESIAKLMRKCGGTYLHLHYAKFGCFACRVDPV